VSQPGGDVSYTGGELERRPEGLPEPPPENLPVPYRRGGGTNVVDWAEFGAWARGRGVVLSGMLLIAAQLIWKAAFLSHFYFWQDDYHFLELALGHSFSWSYLTYIGAGHLSPGDYAIYWVVARTALYNWTLAATITVVLLAAAGVAALRLLRTLFGNRPAILIPLTVYLLTPLTMPDIRWWSSSLESVPLQIATFMALHAQVCYVRTRKFRHALAAAAWLLFGLAFFEKALILPLLLLAVTSGFLLQGRWPAAIWRALVTYWRGWALQLWLVAGYLIVLATSLRTSSVQPGIPGSSGGVFTFIGEIIKDTFVPGAIGGPWQWFPSSDAEYAYSAPPAALAWLALAVAAAIIGASILQRRHAWRAWAILALWLAGADVAPVLLGRITELGPTVLGLETRYVADAAPVLAVCLGLAFLPVTGRQDAGRRSLGLSASGSQTVRLAAAGLVGAFIIGSVWSVQAFQNVTSSLPDRLYIANARLAVNEAPAGTVIADQPVPTGLMLGTFGAASYAARVIGPMESAGSAARIRWTANPDGTIDHLMVFGQDGRLHQAVIYGQPSVPLAAGRSCQAVRHGQAVVAFASPAPAGTKTLHLAYLAAASANGKSLTVRYGSATRLLTVRPGLHNAYLPELGSAASVTVSGPALAGVCVGGLQAGAVVPAVSGLVIPAAY
jgi:hypothetical protein